jgi:hypothetical protein
MSLGNEILMFQTEPKPNRPNSLDQNQTDYERILEYARLNKYACEVIRRWAGR